MKLKQFIDILINQIDNDTIGIGSEVFFDVKAVESYQDFAKLSDIEKVDICEDGGDLVLVFH